MESPMDEKEILAQVTEMVNDREFERYTPADLGRMLMTVLETDHDDLSEKAVSSLFLVAASLMRDHVEAVEKDVFAVRDIYQKR
jgi:hypothetical protein